VPFNHDSYLVAAYPPDGEPYVLSSKAMRWPPGAVVKQEVNLALRRGVRVLGTVKEAPSGKPVAGAVVDFASRQRDTPFVVDQFPLRFDDLRDFIKTGADGKFAMVVLPGPSHLLVSAPTPDYVHIEILAQKLFGPDVPNHRYYPDGLVALDLKPGTDTHQVEVTLKRGVTLKGRVLGPDGKPAASGHLLCRCYVPIGYTLTSIFSVPIKDGRFELPGWDPANPAPLYILCPELGAGGVVKLKAGAGAEPTVRLQKAGGAKVRVLDRTGKPLANAQVLISLPLSPGLSGIEGFGGPNVMADEAYLVNYDRKNFQNLRTDARGEVEVRGLIPGARHRLFLNAGVKHAPVNLDAEAGKTLKLKDVTLDVN
jgi:hypothetical protein